MKTIVKNGKIVSPSETYEADLCIENGVISCIGTNLEQKFASDEVQVIDAAGKYVLPGGVDVHTHMDLDVGFSRAVDDFYDGTVAAAAVVRRRSSIIWRSDRSDAICIIS